MQMQPVQSSRLGPLRLKAVLKQGGIPEPRSISKSLRPVVCGPATFRRSVALIENTAEVIENPQAQT